MAQTTAAPQPSPPTPPSQTHHTIVALETFFVPIPPLTLPPGHTYTLHTYPTTTPSQIASRIRPASILILSIAPLTAALLSPSATPHLQLVALVASGTDNVDLAACRARRVAVCNTPDANAAAVAEHALALYFATRRSLVLSHNLLAAGRWPERRTLQGVLDAPDGRPPRTARGETLGIVGFGAVGRLLGESAGALGMRVLVSARKGEAEGKEDGVDIREGGRTPFRTLLRTCSVIALCLPRTPATLNLISAPELSLMPPHAILINISRGGIVDEGAVVAALRGRRIAGYGTDVYALEPAGPHNSPLVAAGLRGEEELNLVTTPHVAWCAEDTVANFHKKLRENVRCWLETGMPKYPVG
ncbi:uncharacterized protein GGS25DRAFT_532251 [Hypoxylon fragiforme]|uniref:uncharacterized protein n=1 Tax=Hypoxylon fragiforme TaxID=63214 RepID=UPI0020C70E12|nr:uncharacterized protein GGS25DRAFT_532251 [Hypoxylon fragiforme]KAI2607004.1 hypothetical protein GGS25DRAFT_532251 [Hypoxylon fragiforme]